VKVPITPHHIENRYYAPPPFAITGNHLTRLFIPIFCVLPVSLRDFLYREKNVGGGLCHGHISHLVHPKTLILDRQEHAKK